MEYLTYNEYLEFGGELSLAAFTRLNIKVSGMIDRETNKRAENEDKIPEYFKYLCFDLIEYLDKHKESYSGKEITSKSQSAGGVSESESYAVKTSEQQAEEIDNIFSDYLDGNTDKNGTPWRYRGCIA